MEQIREFLTTFEWFSVTHVPRSLNSIANELSKDAIQLDGGIS
jgi:hypothetical protein